MRVMVRKCPFTGQLYEEKERKQYIEHLHDLREQMKLERRHKCIVNEWQKWLAEQKQDIKYVADIPDWFLANQRKIMDFTNDIEFASGFHRRNRFVEQDKFVKLQWEYPPKYSRLVSNTHSCPHNGVTNWGSNPDKPVGYPGWSGNLHGSLIRPKNNEYSYPYSEALNIVGIRTGTGGGGNKNFSYGFKIFVSDWPGLQYEIDGLEQDQMVRIIKGQR
jgi:hypothetical protein